MNTTVKTALYLISCEIHGVQADSARLAGIDRKALRKLTSFHSLSQIVGNAVLKAAPCDLSEEERQKWENEKASAMRRAILFSAETSSVCEGLEKAEISHMIMKGRLLGDLYPEFWMRKTSDCDIFYDETKQTGLAAVMTSLGYPEANVCGNTDVYRKPPIFNFEMHRSLFGENEDAFCKYYADLWHRLKQEEGRPYSFRFSDEDFYVFFIAHSFKHYRISGTGLRTLLDCYLYNRAKRKNCDEAYLRRELKALQLEKYEESLRLLSDKLFGDAGYEKNLTEKEEKELSYYIGSGTYGTEENQVKNRLSGEKSGEPAPGKFGYFMRRIFPGKKELQRSFPVCKKHPVLIPVFWLVRLLRAVFRYGKKTLREIITVIRT